MIKFLKTKQDDKYGIRVHGHTFLATKEEVLRYIETGVLFFKANHPVTLKNVHKYL